MADVMSDVVEALRIGASDYLTKPIADLFIIEHAIIQAMLTAATPMNASGQSHLHEMNELSYQELTDNLLLLEQNAHAAKSVQQHFTCLDIAWDCPIAGGLLTRASLEARDDP